MTSIWKNVAVAATVAFASLVLAPAAFSATFTVNTTNDVDTGVCDIGHCSLREAINAANAVAGADIIAFSIGTGAQTIQPTTAFPTVTDAVTIDGTSQPGFTGSPLVEIDGSTVTVGPLVDGLRLAGTGGSTVRGLVINNFSALGSAAIDVGGTGGNTIQGNFLGTDLSGTAAKPNYYGIDASTGGHTIGGANAADRNVISGNSNAGIDLSGTASNTVAGNYIGTSASGSAALGNGASGVEITSSADNNTIGGAAAGARNVISGNAGRGVLILDAGTSGNVVEGNYIGLNASGNATIPNSIYGVQIQGTDANTVRANVISGNASGIVIGGGVATAGQTIEQNRIGWDASLTTVLGQLGAGIVISNSSGNAITGNAIAGHTDVGILIDTFGGTAVANAIRSTTFRGNNGLGIDLVTPEAARGVTPNDTGDADTGANELQNFPVLTSAIAGSGGTTIDGTLNTAASRTYNLDFFSSATCTSATDREGETYLGTTTVTTNASGDASFSHTVPTVVATSDKITATATDDHGNTSEFSACQDVTAPSSTFTVNTTNDVVDGTCNAAHCSLPEAINAANAAAGANTIAFAVGSGPITIQPSAPLGVISGPTVLDATTQPGYAGRPIVFLNGSSMANGTGFFVTNEAGPVTIRGFVIGNWRSAGILLDGGGNTIEDNFVGVDPTGEASAGNGIDGIQLVSSDGNTIRRNVISGNGRGISIFIGSDTNTITGNRIGTDDDGESAIPNTNVGIAVQGNNNTIGGDGAAQNTIAYNGLDGVQILNPDVGTSTVGNRIGPNSIFGNSGLGIDLDPDGVTPNDGAGDPDAGPNGLQNTPVLTSATIAGGSTRIAGNLLTAPSASAPYRIDFYANPVPLEGPVCDPSGSGEGARWIGFANVSTDARGLALIDTGAGITAPVTGGEAITATATAPDGSTSEFSACVTATGGGTVELLTSASQCPSPGTGGTTVTFEEGIIEGTVAERYSDLGLHFLDDAVRTPFLNTDRIDGAPTQSPPTSLFNSSEPTINPAASLSMTFDEPQTAVGMYIGNNQYGFNPTATLTAYSAEGTALGSVSVPVALNDVTQFFGIARSLGGIRRVELNYGDTSLGEEIDDLCFVATAPEEEEGEADPAIELTSDRRVLPVAAQLVPLGAVPGSQLPAFSGSPGTGPVGSIPIGSVPIGSVPIGSVPIGSVPIGSVPIGSVPIGSVPIGSVPIGSVGLHGVPIGSVGLDGIQLSALPIDWASLLGSNVPVQTLTLADVYADATWRQKFEELTLAESGLTRSILGSLTFPAILLGDATLAQIPPPGATTWCSAIQNAGGSCAGVNTSTNTVAGLGIAGIPIGSVPIGSVPIGSVPIGSVPIGSVPIASVDLEAARLSGIHLSAITNVNTVVDCSRISCTTGTLGGAAALTPSAIRPNATLSALVGAFGNVTINDIIIGILPRSALAWESFPLDGLQLYAGTGDEAVFTLSFDLTCPLGTFSANVRLPTGYIIKRGTTRVRYGTGTAVDGPDPTTNARTGARWTSLPGTPCAGVAAGGVRRVNIDFRAVGGYTLGVHTSTASVVEGGETRSATDQAPVTTRQNWEPNDDPATAPTLAPDRLGIVHVASSGDDEVFRVAIPATAGTKTTFLLSHIEDGADFDLVVQQPATTTLQSSPIASVPIGSVPVEDHGSDFSNQDTTIPPETLQDIPIGSVPIGSVPIASVSANRGSADEIAEVVASGETGFYTVTIRGYNGSHSDLPAVLRVKQTPPVALPPCPARTFEHGAGTQGVLAASLPATTKTLFLLNRSRLNRLYGQATTDEMRTEAQALLGRSEIQGALLEVDGDAAVRNAYGAWDAEPCSTEAANNVVRAINGLVATYRGGLPNLRYVVILGTDEALPMARISDPTTISNETDEAGDLAFTTTNLTRGNALHTAAARAKFLSDAPYGTLAQIPWLGRQLYLPELSVGRLVETPTDIRRQLALYAARNGELTASSAFTTGYDFLTDGADAIDDQLTSLAGGNADRLLSDTWTATDLAPKFHTKPIPDSVISVNAHYSHWLLQPAAGAALVSTGQLPAIVEGVDPKFAARILFTMGCHGGLNVADTLLPNSTSARLRDWAQSYGIQQTAVYVANTGFGYGDTESNALSERLMGLFAKRLREARPIGESWTAALGDYFLGAGAYGVYDEKVLQEATFFGMPHWRITGATAPTAPTAPTLDPDDGSGIRTAQLSFSGADLGVSEAPATARGRHWVGANGTVDVHYRPIQPRVDRDVTQSGGLVAHGAIIRALSTNDVSGVDPATSLPTIDLTAHEPERDFRDSVFPASIVNLTRARGPFGDRQWLVVTPGQFRPATPVAAAGIERLVLSAQVEVAYSTSSDFSPPGIELVGSTFDGSAATIVVETSEAVRRVAAIFNDTLSWRYVELTNVAGTNRWTASVTASHAIEVAAMAQDAAGNVGHSTNKGFNFTSVADSDGPDILIESPGELQIFTLGAEARASYACSDPAGVVSCVGTVPNNGLLDTSSVGTKAFTVRATDTGGRVTTETRHYVVRYAFSRFLPPIDNPPVVNIATAGQTIPVKWQLRTASGAFIRSLAVVKKTTVTVIDCANRPADPLPDTPPGAASGLTYDTAGEQYQFNWSTQRSWRGTCRRLTIEFDDGAKPFADFSFR